MIDSETDIEAPHMEPTQTPTAQRPKEKVAQVAKRKPKKKVSSIHFVSSDECSIYFTKTLMLDSIFRAQETMKARNNPPKGEETAPKG